MGKAPAFQFYIRDWLSDPLLKMVSHTTKGIWIDLLCYLWESPDRGKLTGTHENFIKMLGCTPKEWEQFFNDANVTQFADVTNCNNTVTVCNRRMFREGINRQNTRLRVQQWRKRKACNKKVTPSSSSSSSSSKKYIKESKEIIEYLNAISGRAFKSTDSNIKVIKARLNEGHTKEDCKKVIDTKWADKDFNKDYFRPSTLFGASKFEGYLNQDEKPKRYDEEDWE